MDPVTAAIVAALAAGVASGITKVGESVLIDAYDALKTLLRKRFGEDSEVIKAVANLEARPDSIGRRETLKEEITATKADQDKEIVEYARHLMGLLSKTPKGQEVISQTVTGDSNIFSATGDVTVTGQFPKSE